MIKHYLCSQSPIFFLVVFASYSIEAFWMHLFGTIADNACGGGEGRHVINVALECTIAEHTITATQVGTSCSFAKTRFVRAVRPLCSLDSPTATRPFVSYITVRLQESL